MKVATRSLLLLTVLAWPASAFAQTWMTLDFQQFPFVYTGPFPSSPRVVDQTWDGGNTSRTPGPCGQVGPGGNYYWNYERVAAAAGNGGYNSRGYARFIWCDWDVSHAGDASELSGWGASGRRFEPGGTGLTGQNNWPTTFYGRLRIYIEQPMTVNEGAGGQTNRQLKFFLWHGGVYGGDQRVIAFLEGGRNCGGTDATHVCFTLQRNINNFEDTATVSLAVGTWHHLQFSWRHGVNGVSYVKIWKDNNNEASPSAQDLNLTGVPSNPGGTTEWVKDNAGYDGGLNLGNAASNFIRFSENFVYRMMDFQLGASFDATWYPGASGNPTQVQNVRIVPPE